MARRTTLAGDAAKPSPGDFSLYTHLPIPVSSATGKCRILLPASIGVMPMTLRLGLAAVCLGLLAAGPAGAEDFRVENKVFTGSDNDPSAESTTIFYNGVVYDYLKKPAETMVLDKDRGRLVLLDTGRRIKTELTTQEVEAFTDRLQERAARRASRSDNPFVAFQADPKFEQEFDETSRELTFRSPWMTYRVVTADAQSKEIAQQYRQFADWQARINSVINRRAIPPFARLLVNAELERREEVPREVHLTLRPPGGFPPRRITAHSEHQLIRTVVESDRRRVLQTGQFMAIFQPVSFEEYQKAHANE
jgi:hypothetical protein